jgi:hypothetical protein
VRKQTSILAELPGLSALLLRFDHVARITRSAATLEGLSQQLKLNKAIL